MLKDHVLSNEPDAVVILSPDSTSRVNRKRDYEQGPIEISDTTQGIIVAKWKAYLEGSTKIYITKEDAVYTPYLFLEDVNLKEVSLSFDQLGKPVVVYVKGTTTYLAYYNSSSGTYTHLDMGETFSPTLTKDLYTGIDVSGSDVMFFYFKSNRLYYRIQRENYATERVLTSPVMSAKSLFIRRIGMTSGYRIAVEVC